MNDTIKSKPKKKVRSNLTVNLIHDMVLANTPLTVDMLKSDLTNLANQCRQAISEPARLGQLLRNVDHYKTNLSEEQYKNLEERASILVKDLGTFNTLLDEIVADQTKTFNATDDLSELQIASFGIHNNYVNWTEQFSHVVLPIAGEITGLIGTANNNAADRAKAVN